MGRCPLGSIGAVDVSTWTGRRDCAMLTLDARTGLRASELVCLTVADAHFVPARTSTAWARPRAGGDDRMHARIADGDICGCRALRSLRRRRLAVRLVGGTTRSGERGTGGECSEVLVGLRSGIAGSSTAHSTSDRRCWVAKNYGSSVKQAIRGLRRKGMSKSRLPTLLVPRAGEGAAAAAARAVAAAAWAAAATERKRHHRPQGRQEVRLGHPVRTGMALQSLTREWR
jgi:hypothetical protein